MHAPFTQNLDEGRIGCSHQRARAGQKCALGCSRMIVEPENCVAWKAFKQSVGDHGLCATHFAGFFGGLENQIDGSTKVARASGYSAAPSSIVV